MGPCAEHVTVGGSSPRSPPPTRCPEGRRALSHVQRAALGLSKPKRQPTACQPRPTEVGGLLLPAPKPALFLLPPSRCEACAWGQRDDSLNQGQGGGAVSGSC